MYILSIDFGTTNWKAGIFNNGCMEDVARMPNKPNEQGVYEISSILPGLSWLCQQLDNTLLEKVEAIALTGMAEACLMTADDKTPLTDILPWSSSKGQRPFEKMHRHFGDRQKITGLPDNQKYGIYKLMALREEGFDGKWLGAVEYLALVLTGKGATEPTFAARTGCYDVFRQQWDNEYLLQLGMAHTDFPSVVISGEPMGSLTPKMSMLLKLKEGIPVCICGHDHLCARHAAGQEDIFISMGTAMVCLGSVHNLTDENLATGLSFGPDVVGQDLVCLGSIQSAGGAVNAAAGWMYESGGITAMVKEVKVAPPSKLLFFPYLTGSGAPHMDRLATGAFVGITGDTTREDFVNAVYAGIGYECRLILERAGLFGAGSVVACGGLTHHTVLLKTMANILAMPVNVVGQAEATMYGAASLASRRITGQGFKSLEISQIYQPDMEAHRAYSKIYTKGYLALQEALRGYDHRMEG